MKYRDLRDFIAQLEQLGELKRVVASHDPHAFVIIGTTQQALGEGFTELRQRG